MIFDITLQDIKKLIEIVGYCDMSGYDRENIHIVWVLNDFNVARQQNSARERTVSDEVLERTHSGASQTIHNIIKDAQGLTDDYDGGAIIDGDMWILFNKRNVDNFVRHSVNGGNYVDKINAIKIKEKGQPIKPFEDIMAEFVKVYDEDGNLLNRNTVTVRDKVTEYVPANTKDIGSSQMDNSQ